MNKVVIVTGATSGFGLATAKKFLADGDKVIVASRNEEKVNAIVKEFGFADGFTIDVTDYDKWIELKEFVQKKYGKIDVLVNNAGAGLKIAEADEQGKDDIDNIIKLNLNSVLYGCSVFASTFKAQKDGVIVNISSVCARHAWPGWSVYAAAKSGVLNYTKGLYLELQPYGVRASCVIPASASTGFQKGANIGETNDSLSVDDIANAVFFVANQPKRAVVEDVTVWGVSQVCNPL